MLSRQAKHLACDTQILRFAQNDIRHLICDEILLVKAKKLEPLFGFAFGQAVALTFWLFGGLLPAQFLPQPLPEILRFYRRRSSRSSRSPQSAVAADDYQSSRRGIGLYLVFDYRVSIPAGPGKKDIRIRYIFKYTFIPRPHPIEDDFAAFADQLQIPPYYSAQLNLANGPGFFVCLRQRHSFPNATIGEPVACLLN